MTVRTRRGKPTTTQASSEAWGGSAGTTTNTSTAGSSRAAGRKRRGGAAKIHEDDEDEGPVHQQTTRKDTVAGDNGTDTDHVGTAAAKDDVTMVSSSSSSSSSSSNNNDNGNLLHGASSTQNESNQRQPQIAPPEGVSSSCSHRNGGDGSRLYYPFHTIGLITSRHKFHLQNHGPSSDTSFVTTPLGDRFHVYKGDGLRCVMVGEGLPRSKTSGRRQSSGGVSRSSTSSSKSGTPEVMAHVISDASLQVTVCVHSPRGKRPSNVTLYNRTKAIRTTSINNSKGHRRSKTSWGISDVIQLGKVKVDAGTLNEEKESKRENALLVALVCSRNDDDDGDDDGIKKIGNDGVEIVGDDNDSDDEGHSSEDDSSTGDSDASSSSSEDEEVGSHNHRGEVILLLASRSTLHIKKRLVLSTLPTFAPTIGMHPSTYVNKVVLGGSDTSTGKTKMVLLNVRSGKVVHDFKCLTKFSERGEAMTAMEQSPAVDTIAVGTSLGQVHLLNLRHDVKLFTLRHSRRTRSGSVTVKITALSFRTDGVALRQGLAPLAVGRDDGDVSVWNLTPKDNDSDDDEDDRGGVGKRGRSREAQRTLLTTLSQIHSGGVSHLTYLPNEPLLLSSGTKSNSLIMTIFDSPDHSGRQLRSRVGHSAPPGLIRYLHPGSMGGSILANAADGTDASSCQILSAGGARDRTLRVFSTARSVLDKEYSQGKGLTKRARDLGLKDRTELLLPEIVGLTTCEARSRDWGDLVTIHRDHAMAYVWSTRRGAQSGPVLRQSDWNVSAMKVQPPVRCHATAVCISSCGNFALVGTKGGVIYRYNIQSGIARGSYPKDATAFANKRKGSGSGEAGSLDRTMRILEKKMRVDGIAALEDGDDNEEKAVKSRIEERRKARLLLARHDGAAVTGLAVDALNKTLISVGADSKLILWSFATRAPHRRSPIYLLSPATKVRHVRDSDLAAIALEDYSILVFDCEALKVVRRFGLPDQTPAPSLAVPSSVPSTPRHTGPITDLSFSPSGRRLLTSSLDNTIRVWDVPTATCVDWMRFSTAPTSVALSPTGEYMATTHINKVGVGLWCDRSFFQTVHLDGGRVLSEPARMDDPAPLAEDSGSDEDSKLEADFAATFNFADEEKDGSEEDKAGSSSTSLTPKDDGLITLSGLPSAHWKNLFHLELVKERNKPKEAPQKPPQAPFFLQFRAGEGVLSNRDGGDLGTASGGDKGASDEKDMEKWDAVWSENEEDERMEDIADKDESGTSTKREESSTSRKDEKGDTSTMRSSSNNDRKKPLISSRITTWGEKGASQVAKRRKMAHHRSHLASLLIQCYDGSANAGSESKYDAVTNYIATLGPSAIDIALSTLCQGMHDLDDGLHLLHLASLWLLEAINSRRSYEAVNAYLHRFLTLHSAVIANIDDKTQHRGMRDVEDAETDSSIERKRADLLDAVSKLRRAQREADEKLRGKMQHTLCLLRHFSRMV